MKYFKIRRKKVDECDGGVCMPVQTLSNTVGVGNAVPASMAAQTAADQCSPDCIGSGDNFGNIIGNVNTQAKPQRKKRKVYRVRKRKPTKK